MKYTLEQNISNGRYPSKEVIIQEYVEGGFTKQQFCEKYNISGTTLNRLLKHYDLSKVNNIKLIYPDKDRFYQFYIVENHNVNETLQEFPE